MTREEALEWFKDRKKMNLDDKCQQAEDMAIKALKQEPVLDKIRAEIESQRQEVSKQHYEDYELQAFNDGLNDGLKDARDIIDKYRESED